MSIKRMSIKRLSLKNIARFLSKLFFILIFAGIFLIIVIEEDGWLKQQLEQKITTAFNSSFNCTFTTKVSRIRFFAGSIELTNTHAQDPHGDTWHWHADTITINFSWLKTIINKKLAADITIKNIKLSSLLEGKELAIMPHIKAFITPGAITIPFEPKRLIIQQGTLTLVNNLPTRTPLLGLQFRSDISMNNGHTLNIVINNGYGLLNAEIINKLEAHITGTLHKQNTQLNLVGSCNLPQLSTTERCSIQGSFDKSHGTLTLDTPSHSLYGTANLNLSNDTIAITAQTPVAYCAQFIAPQHAQKIKGACSIAGTAKLSDLANSSAATIMLKDMAYGIIKLPDINTKITYNNNNIAGLTQTTINKLATIEGAFSFDLATRAGSCRITNTTPIKLPEEWSIASKGFNLALRVTGSEIEGSYNIRLQHAKEIKKLQGKLAWNPEQLIVQGSGDKFHYDFLAGAKPFWHLEYLDCHLGKELVIALKTESPTIWAGTVGYPLIRFILNALGLSIPGEGNFTVRGSTSEHNIELSLAMKDGNIRLPYTYNLLQDLTAKLIYNFSSQRFTLDNVNINLHKGSVASSRITGKLDENYTLSYLHVPSLLNNCFFSRKKEFFALFSGALTFEYIAQAAARLTGFVQLDRAHIKSNIFSDEFRKQMFSATASPVAAYGTDLEFDVHVMSRTPLRVKTDFLEAATRINLGLIGSIAQPTITGGIEILNGSFMFPYKPLFIKRGSIYFLPQQLDDPIIDIFAENTIKKYSIRMTVDGSAKSPRISFDATPTLQEEQIVGLLLGGSEDGSLYLALPNSVMSSVENLIFGPADSMSQFQRKLQTLFTPLKNLRITPKFSDQTGRGGLRGALTIDVNDRLRGIIEQNFSLSEDTVIEVEYDISDDTRIRAIKDVRGDLGGEVEGRWKF